MRTKSWVTLGNKLMRHNAWTSHNWLPTGPWEKLCHRDKDFHECYPGHTKGTVIATFPCIMSERLVLEIKHIKQFVAESCLSDLPTSVSGP